MWRILFEFIESLVVAGAIFVIIYFFLFRPFQVNGASMYPTYENGELIITNIVTLRFQPIKRGDVIVFKAPPNEEKDFIKRIVGMPEERISAQGGNVFINGNKLDESSYLPLEVKTYGGSFLNENSPVSIPAGSYFVMGDNRNFSSDSREWGFVQKEKIIGKSFVVIWPIKNFKVIKDPLFNEVNLLSY